MTYEHLLIEADNLGIDVIEKEFYSDAKGLCKGSRIGINKKIHTTVEKACILAEELGHYYTTVGNILDQNKIENIKQERIARLWAYDKQIGLEGIIKAYKEGCRSRHEAAECLDVTEEFLQDAIECYRSKFGHFVEVDNYIIFFEPSLAVLEKSA